MNLYDRITKNVVLKQTHDEEVKKRETLIKSLQETNRELFETVSLLRRELAMYTKYTDNTPDKKGAQSARYDLDHFHVVRRKDGEIIANLLANRPINTPSLVSVPADRTKHVGETITLTKE